LFEIGKDLNTENIPSSIAFNLPQKYKVVKKLGEGACGQTLQIRDDDIGSDFVVKKYHPVVSKSTDVTFFSELLNRFKDEARILFKINHPNIVRIFNFFDYRDYETSYIVMEMILGENIQQYTSKNPAELATLFEKTIEGFAHLENKQILHRDIRPDNIIVSETGEPKIIDFGFGKDLAAEKVDDKSISLNWWCPVPPEFNEKIYDFQTEVYFVGKLFEQIMQENSLTDFKYVNIVAQMCRPDRNQRPKKFSIVRNNIVSGQFEELEFNDRDIQNYRYFSNNISNILIRVDGGCRYNNEISDVLGELESLYRKTMLEEVLPNPAKITQVFLKGGFRYNSNYEFPVEILKDFIQLLRGLSNDKRMIVLSNLFSKLDAIDRHWPEHGSDEEIPF